MNDSRRKHRQQMSQPEINFIEDHVHGVSGWSYIEHCIDRMRDKRVKYQQVLETLQTGYVIEMHNNVPGDLRVVMRKDYDDISVCVAASLTTQDVVTVWWNKPEDRHDTLNLSKYLWRVDLSRVMRQALNT